MRSQKGVCKAAHSVHRSVAVGDRMRDGCVTLTLTVHLTFWLLLWKGVDMEREARLWSAWRRRRSHRKQ
jgi:hypothetical protein